MSETRPADFEWSKALTHLREGMALEADWTPLSLAAAAYYAAFHAALAVILLEDATGAKTHASVVGRCGRLVKDREEPLRQTGRDLNRLMDLRMKADYQVAEHVSPEEASSALQTAIRLMRLCSAEFGFPAPDA